MKRNGFNKANRGFPAFVAISFIFSFVSCTTIEEPVLKDAFADDFYIGTALNRWQIMGKDSVSMDIALTHFNSVTAENAMKWMFIHPKPEVYDFDVADKLVELGEEHDLYVVGHCLVWHSQSPPWVFRDSLGDLVDRETLLERMREHIDMVMTRYKGKVHCWDVVNEAIDDDGNMRNNIWYQIIGEDYVEKAFEYAAEIDPDADLIYNDYSLPNAPRREGVVKLIKSMQDKGIKVDGIGLQAHYYLDYPDIEDLEASIIAFGNLGVEVMITEMDISVLPFPSMEMGADIARNFEMREALDPFKAGLPDTMQVKLADRYGEMFDLFVKHNDVVSRVTLWGISDAQSWKNNWPVRGRTDYPLLFDREKNPKPAFHSVYESGK